MVNRYSNKPEFLRKKNENKSDNNIKSALRETERDISAGLAESDLDSLEISDGSFIEFYKNGHKQSEIFQDIWEADYFASVSLYMNAKVSVNFG